MAHDESDRPIEFGIFSANIQCMMCKFDFVEGEKIVARLNTDCFSEEFVFHGVRRLYSIKRASKPHRLLYYESWPRQLPCEVWRMIASYLVRETAIAVALGQKPVSYLRSYRPSSDSSRPTYTSVIKIDGQPYIQKRRSSPKDIDAMLNSSKDALDKSEFMFQLPLLDRNGDYFAAVDAFGVLRVFPVSRRQRKAWCRNYPAIPGAWWYLMLDYRQIDRYPQCIYWKVPMIDPPTIIDVSTVQELPRSHLLYLRMRFFECNSPDIVGYSVALDHRGNLPTVFVWSG
ncbi:hypothetical protein CEP54_008419 [Fusarium duplospermum]|uniref:Uncharacterized protein n=1 Tax=Fusarium duplospermum TaxID=1325734 RepID=A0A428PW08_9HYPO|nr:hypothetical protein CEP54_008419 [Fusarium duplospermum]